MKVFYFRTSLQFLFLFITSSISATTLNFSLAEILNETKISAKNVHISLDEVLVTQTIPFVSVWDTEQIGTSADNQITIPINPAFTNYNYTIDWGDGMMDTGVTGAITHTYATPNTYTVSITGTFPAIYFNGTGDRRKIIEIISWGNIQWQSMENAFYGCQNLNFDAIAAPDLSQVTSLKNMFRNATLFNGILNGWDVSTITNISGMFQDCDTFNRPLDAWTTNSITDMSYTFDDANNFNEPLDNWNTGSVTTMASMFRSANDFNQNINNWNVSQVTNMSSMFYASDMAFPLNSWDVSQVTLMNEMFGSTPFNQPLDLWQVGNVTDMSGMFRSTPFNQNIEIWIVSSVTNMASMFERNYSFNQPLNGWDVSSVTNMSNMFAGIFSSITAFDQPLDIWDVSSVTDMSDMFESSSFNQPIGDWDVSSVTIMAGMFDTSSAFNQPIEGWDVSSVTNMAEMFDSAVSFNQPLNAWNVANVSSMNSMFQNANSFNQLLDSWVFNTNINLTRMFRNASAFDQNLGSWNMTIVSNVSQMLNNSGLSETNYNNTLIAWAAQDVVDGLTLGANTLLYCDGRFARQDLIDNQGWTILDDVFNCSFVLCTDIISPEDGDINVPENFNLVWEEVTAATGYYLTVTKDTGGTVTTLLDNVNVGLITTYDFPVDFTPGDIVTAKVVPFNGEGAAEDCITETYTIIESWINSPEAFKLTYNTSTTDSNTTPVNQLKISKNSSYTYNYSIDWGDDQFNNNVTQTITHTYDTPGTYTVSIIGDYPAHYFNYSNTDNIKLITIDQWGSQQWQSMDQSFLNCQNMTYNASDVPDLSQVESMRSTFYQCFLFDADINNWNVSNVTNMSNLFAAAFVFNSPLNSWDVSNVTNMSGLFLVARDFNQPINSWDVSSVTNMYRMFDGNGQPQAFNQPLNDWNVENVIDMGYMFRYTPNFNQPLDLWDVSSVTTMNRMFENATAFNQNIDFWNVENVTNMDAMFSNADAFNEPLNSWNVENVLTMRSMFQSTNVFNQPLNDWNTFSCVNMSSMFQNAVAFDQPLNNWEVATVTNMSYMFDSSLVFNQDISAWNVSQVTNMTSMFEDAFLFDQPLAPWNVNSVVNMTSMFEDAQAFNQPIGGWDVSAVANTTSMFERAQLFDQPLENWNVSSVTIMESMFESAQVFNQNINDWDVSSVTNTRSMFENSTVFNQPLGDWDTGEILTTEKMFNGASAFNQPINTWDTSFVTNMESMFEDAIAYNQELNDWNVASVQTMERMFKGASLFNQNINSWNTREVTTMEEMFEDAIAFNEPLNNWRVRNVTNMSRMFQNATMFNQELSEWDLEEVEMRAMFRLASAFDQYLGDWNLSQTTNLSQMLDNSGMSRMNYDNTVIAWAEQDVPLGLTLGALNVPYCDAFEERESIIANYGWTFSGDVLDCPIPECTQLISPFNTEIDVPVNTNLSWEPAVFARGYRLTVTSVPTNTNNVVDIVLVDQTSYNFINDFSGGEVVTVTIVPYNDTGEAMGCTSEIFTIINSPTPTIPACTSLTSPLDGAVDVAVDTDLSWNPISNADGYKISVGTTTGGIDILDNFNVGNVTTYDLLNDLPENSIIYITITPFNEVDDAASCTEESFTTEIIPVPPICTTLTSPLDGTMDVPLDTNLTWMAVPNTTGYLLSVGTTPGGIEVLNSIDVENITTYDFITDLDEDRTYYVRITPYNNVGDAASCTEESFTTETPSNVIAMCMDITVQLDASGSVTITPANIDGGSSDPDGPVILTIDTTSFDCSNIGSNTVTLTVTDNEGNIASCQATVTVEDNVAPIIDCLDNQTEEIQADCMFTIPDYTALANISDNCSSPSITQSPAAGTLVGIGITEVTIDVTDGTNPVSCTFEIEVLDTVAPVVNCADNFTVELDASGMASIIIADIDLGATDNCGVSVMIDITEFTCDNLGDNTVTLTATDGNGLTTMCTTIVTVTDPLFACNAPPVAVCQEVIVSANSDCMGEAVSLDFDGGSTDPEGEALTFTILPEGPYPLGITDVTLTVSDGVLNSSCTTTITVIDNTPPTLTCIDEQIVDADSFCSFTIPDYTTMVTASDNCSTLTVTQFPVAGAIVSSGTTVITVIANDGTNQVSCSFNLVVNDVTTPTANCQDITVQLDASGIATIEVADIDGGSIDSCGNITTTIDISTFDCSNIGDNIVTLTVTDDSGLESICTAIVTVEDIFIPEAVCQNITVQLDATGVASITPADIDNGSTDNCGVPTLEIDVATFDCSNVGDNLVTLTVTDNFGNTNTCIATVTVIDDIAPVANCQNITVQLDATGVISITPADIDNGSTDNCGNVTTTININTFDCSNVGENEVILTVTDASGLSSTCTAIVTVEDNEAPIVNCQDITIELDENGMAAITALDIDGGSTDPCGIATTEIDIDTFDCSNLGDNNVTLTVTDINGNQSNCIAIVTVIGTSATPIAVCQNLTVPLGADGTATIEASALNGGSSGTSCPDGYSISIDTFSCEDIGNPVQVVFTVTNALGVSDSCVALVNVVDTLAPEVFCPDDQTVISTGPYILPDYFATGEAMAIDNCTDPVTVFDQEPSPGTALEQGTYTITISAQDANGFENECTFELTVNDTLGTIDLEPTIATVLLYPNPANNVIRISNPQLIQLEKIIIYDLNGRVVLTEILSKIESSAIDVSLLQSATYLVTIESDARTITKRMVKE
ncbi:BspA family leucine-rich repeat surface protein [Patiriisocius marinus]|uniref:BspA family leucine-rich repeat surface protein n=1 Tax=Patiriisocius marinus TaxID=1397112 RepID=UPI00232B8D2E|nr:BspA family leucine-rich repeat surface protein [Patiriisocius marinus]